MSVKRENNTYEIAVIFRVGKLQKVLEDLGSSLLESVGGEVSRVDFWGERELSFPIKKESKGVYVFFEFSLAEDKLPELRRIFKMEVQVLRSRIIKRR